MQDPTNNRARLYKHFVKHADKNKMITGISNTMGVEADIGPGTAGLAARQLLSESVLSAGATFTDEDVNKPVKGKGKGKQKGGRQAWVESARVA